MGINNHFFDVLAEYCRLPAGYPKFPALIAGYPDMLVGNAMLEKHFGHSDFAPDAAADEIIKRHGDQKYEMPRAPQAVFSALGYDPLVVVDINQERGCEVVVDLNEPQDDLAEQFALVVDHGTIEHCFNIAQAAKNLASAVVKDGYIATHLPLSFWNHGFYNLNPTWYAHFYTTNGFELSFVTGWTMSMGEGAGLSFSVPPVHSFVGVPEFSFVTMIARRVEMKPITYPIQQMLPIE